MYSDITGIILAGGKSSRMGLNKSFLKIGDETIIERITDLMQSIFNDVIIITNSPKEYLFLQIPMYEDIYKWRGPLAGIHSGLTHSSTEVNFIISCDVPLMSKEMIEFIVEYKSDRPIKFCKAAGYHQPLAGIYKKEIIKKIEDVICIDQVSDKSFHQFLKSVDAEIIHPENLSFYNDEIFFNMNKKEDYEELLKSLRGK
ncbi:MAG: molybdenum cofactor guanylyltransferase [Ignavibacteriaceae bacterium]|nr:molybdenum cofactor guanylyltransferase [Ignavibacteriaceae bacterium]HRN26399.1 molybdenum cofactor guanylyltransferase [Ignavibacteriaceae bacterium]HRP93767.1 molybdenum cofactor guanylyltransferase [Ignavibacteriaceae bacterium]HRQ54032.1 molybdenum cofactor guanylyltransferase [Ignavibacteriaceae bacterium]